MEPLSLAVVSLLVSYFKQAAGKLAERAGDAVADAALPKLKALYERVRARLAPDSYEGALLDGVQAQPDEPGRQEILKAELSKILKDDQQFASELERLVGEVQQAGSVQIAATDTGIVAGRDVSLHGRFVAGRDMRVNGIPDSDP